MHIPQRRTSQGQQPQRAQAMGSPDAGAGRMEGWGRRGRAVSLASSSRPSQGRSSQGVGAGDGEEASGR